MNNNYSLVFVTHYTDLYGANRSMLDLIDGLQKNNITDISVVVPHKGHLCKKLDELSVSYVVIPFVIEMNEEQPVYIKRVLKKYYNKILAFRKKKLFSQKKRLIIHSNSSVIFFGAYLAHYLKVPHIWHIREFGNADYNLEYNFGNNYFLKWVNKTAAVICISHAICNDRFKEKITPPITTIYNGVVHEYNIKPSLEQRSVNSIFRFGLSGNITKEKNVTDAIHALHIINKKHSCQLLIAGTGSDNFMNELKQLIKTLQLTENIFFKGFVEDMNSFYNSIDCLLMCAKNEAMGRVTVEAMSKGLPVIGYNNAGTAEIIKSGYNGFLYNNNATELAEKMENLVEDYDAFIQLRVHAVETVKSTFTIETYTNAVMNAYKSVAKNLN